MSRLLRTASVALAATFLLAPAAGASTTRTSASAAQLQAQVDSGKYQRSVDAVYRSATRYLKAQLKKQPKRPAVVLDIDETALSNVGCFEQAKWELSGLAVCAIQGKSKVFAAARAFVRFAQRSHVAVAFVTGTPEGLCDARRKNLRAQGITGSYTVTCRPSSDGGDTVVPYKSGARKALEKAGRTILANIGDQQSDLAGGAAKKTFKVPNPIYVIS
jgi:predicted secreted acid phosphatase